MVVVVGGTVVVVVVDVVVVVVDVVVVDVVVVVVDVVVVVVVGPQPEMSVTDVEPWAVMPLTGQRGYTVNVTLPVDPVGNVVVAEVVPLGPTSAL